MMMKKIEVEQFITIKYMEYIMKLFRTKSQIPFNYVFACTEDSLNIHLMIAKYKFGKQKTMTDLLHSLLDEYEVFSEIDNVIKQNQVCNLRKWLFNDDYSVKSIVEICPKMALLYYVNRFCQISHDKLLRCPLGNIMLKQICDNIYGKDKYNELALTAVRYALFVEDNDKLLTYMSKDNTNYDEFIDRDALATFITLHLLVLQCKVLWDIQVETGSFVECLKHIKQCRFMYIKYIEDYNRSEGDNVEPKVKLKEVKRATLKYERIMNAMSKSTRKIKREQRQRKIPLKFLRDY